MGKITPGPWVASDLNHDGEWRVESDAKGYPNDGYIIATFMGPDAEANARACAALKIPVVEWQLLNGEPPPGPERIVMAGGYSGRGDWYAERWSTKSIAEYQAKVASGLFDNAPHLELPLDYWAEDPAPPPKALPLPTVRKGG